MDSTVLEAYDEQVRRSLSPPAPGWTVERAGPVIRMVPPPEIEWGGGVIASDLDASTADAAIAETLSYFGGLGRAFEWKWFGYDQPADLPDRLVAAGLRPDDRESLVVGVLDEVTAACAGAAAADGVSFRHVRPETADADFAAMGRLHDVVWGTDSTDLMHGVRAEWEAAPDHLVVHLAEAGGQVVCAARVRFHEGTEFASLWGGSTRPAWRRSGIYRVLVARRAEEARERGYRYLQVDASDDSLPILRRLGLHKLTDTVPHQWRPGV